MFITKNKKDYERHIRSKKHKEHYIDLKEPKEPNEQKQQKEPVDTLDIRNKPPMCPKCNKVYKSRTSIYAHMKKCGSPTTINEDDTKPSSSSSSSSSLSHDDHSDVTTMVSIQTQHQPLLMPKSLTPEQIQYILIENKILKELLKNAIHGSIV
jgi:uncharacterized C2H2 Zn-finger protein